MEGQWVMMPVRCIGKICKDCRFLKVDTETGMVKDDDGRFHEYTDLKCRSVERCSRIMQMIEMIKGEGTNE